MPDDLPPKDVEWARDFARRMWAEHQHPQRFAYVELGRRTADDSSIHPVAEFDTHDDFRLVRIFTP
jgi:hypothetical protein